MSRTGDFFSPIAEFKLPLRVINSTKLNKSKEMGTDLGVRCFAQTPMSRAKGIVIVQNFCVIRRIERWGRERSVDWVGIETVIALCSLLEEWNSTCAGGTR